MNITGNLQLFAPCVNPNQTNLVHKTTPLFLFEKPYLRHYKHQTIATTPRRNHYTQTHHHSRTKTHPCVELGSVRPLTAVLPLRSVLPPLGPMHAARIAVGGGFTGAPLVVLVALRAVVLVAVVFVIVVAVAAGMETLVFFRL